MRKVCWYINVICLRKNDRGLAYDTQSSSNTAKETIYTDYTEKYFFTMKKQTKNSKSQQNNLFSFSYSFIALINKLWMQNNYA